jgi:hypothetical protein
MQNLPKIEIRFPTGDTQRPGSRTGGTLNRIILLQNKKVLHISLNQPVGKVSVWYHEVLDRFAQQHKVPQMEHLWETLAPHRFIMTFQTEGFSAPKLEERLTDLTSQNIFTPNLVLIDGLAFDNQARDTLAALKNIAVALLVYGDDPSP